MTWHKDIKNKTDDSTKNFFQNLTTIRESKRVKIEKYVLARTPDAMNMCSLGSIVSIYDVARTTTITYAVSYLD